MVEILYPYIPNNYNKQSSVYFDDESLKQDYTKLIKGLGIAPKKGTYRFKKFTGQDEIIYDVVYNIEKDSSRKSSSEEKPIIHLFGCSLAFGEGLNDNETLSYYLNEDHNLNTNNFAFSGYGIHQALYKISKLNKSAVNGVNLVLTGPFHITRSACKVGYSWESPYYVNKNGLAKLNGNCNFIIRNNFFEKIFYKSNISKLYLQFFTRYGKTTDDDILQYLSIMRSIKKESEKNNSVLVIAYISQNIKFRNTSFNNDKFKEELSKITDKIIDVTLSDDIDIIDRKYYIHKLDRHPTAIANRLRAKKLAPTLKDILLN